MVIDRQRGGIENSVVLVRLVCVCVCVWGVDVVPHLQCSAGLYHPIMSQLSAKEGWARG